MVVIRAVGDFPQLHRSIFELYERRSGGGGGGTAVSIETPPYDQFCLPFICNFSFFSLFSDLNTSS